MCRKEDRFEEIVNEYDLWPIVDPNYEPVQQRLIEIVSEKLPLGRWKFTDILEVGCGTGHTTKLLLDGTPRNVRIWAIDISPGMIEKTKSALCDYLIGRLYPYERDICNPDFGHGATLGSFDMIVSVMTLHNIAPNQRQKACHEIANHLHPDSWFITADQIMPDNRKAADRMYRDWINDLELFRENGMESSYQFWKAHTIEDSERRLTERAQVRMLKMAGMLDVQIIERFGPYAIVVARKPCRRRRRIRPD